jgi:hypothetical protein
METPWRADDAAFIAQLITILVDRNRTDQEKKHGDHQRDPV